MQPRTFLFLLFIVFITSSIPSIKACPESIGGKIIADLLRLVR